MIALVLFALVCVEFGCVVFVVVNKFCFVVIDLVVVFDKLFCCVLCFVTDFDTFCWFGLMVVVEAFGECRHVVDSS